MIFPRVGLVLLLLLSACAAKGGYTDQIYQSLVTSQATYQQALKAAAEADLTQEQMGVVVEVARKYQRAHNLLLTATQDYVRLKRIGADNEGDRYRIAAYQRNVAGVLRELLSVLNSYGVRI